MVVNWITGDAISSDSTVEALVEIGANAKDESHDDTVSIGDAAAMMPSGLWVLEKDEGSGWRNDDDA